MEYWLHRISHEAATSRPLLERGFLTIGFHALSNDAFLNRVKAVNGIHELNSDVRDAYNGTLLRSRHSLWRFLKKMALGDLVLVPSPGEYSVYVVRSEPKLMAEIDPTISEEGIDLGFYREVEVHQIDVMDGKVAPERRKAERISRTDYADSKLTARMKMRQTNGNISDLRENVDAELAAFGKRQPRTLKSHITAITAKELLDAICDRLDPDKFESLLEWYFERLGGTARILAKNERDKEGDCDIEASFERLRLTIHVQAKRHEPGSKTDSAAVEQIGKYADWRKEKELSDTRYATALWVVSTCERFTDRCIAKAEEAGVVLITGIELAHMLLAAGVEGLEL